MRVQCPHCGERNLEEFFFHGSLPDARPKEATNLQEWHDHVYLRDNVRGLQHELWQHLYGCRSWLIVHRDNFSHEIFSVVPANTLNQTRTNSL